MILPFYLAVLLSLIAAVSVRAEPPAPFFAVHALADHDLSEFPSANDFDQHRFTEAQVEAEIRSRIADAVADGVPTRDIEIPFNQKKLHYLGFCHPNTTGLFGTGSDRVSTKNSSSINKTLCIYRYDNFYISTETDTPTDHENVYHAIRALNLLRYRYPKAYQRLFADTQRFLSDRPGFAPYANANKAFWIAFNDAPVAIASSYTSFVDDGPMPGAPTVTRSRNIPIINIHAHSILGGDPKRGSKPIYKKADARENNRLYLRDGLIETLVHEMLHRYIDYAYTADARDNAIRQARDLPGFSGAEECAVMNTSLSFFLREGGLSDAIPAYYLSTVFPANIQRMKDAGTLSDYAHRFSPTAPTPLTNYRDAFSLSVLD